MGAETSECAKAGSGTQGLEFQRRTPRLDLSKVGSNEEREFLLGCHRIFQGKETLINGQTSNVRVFQWESAWVHVWDSQGAQKGAVFQGAAYKQVFETAVNSKRTFVFCLHTIRKTREPNCGH